jgi:SNF family Na+-dependent transporter
MFPSYSCEVRNSMMMMMMMMIIIMIIIIITKKEAEKFLKYKDLTTEIQGMWNVKRKVIPVIIGATGIISKSFRKYVKNIPGNHKVKELQKTAILGTEHTLRKVLT